MTPNAVNLVDYFNTYGAYGLLMIIWYLDNRRIQSILDTYQQDMSETREMYKNNVELVRDYESLARDLHDVVIMNTQAMQATLDAVKTNQFCPLNRIDTTQTKRTPA
jgi:hypothetical protein